MPTKKHRRTPKHKSIKLKKKEKQAIVQRLNPVSFEKATTEYQKLQSMGCSKVRKLSSRTTLGNNIVDAFTLIERLHTKGHQGISFYEFWKNRKMYSQKNYVKNMLTFYKSRNIDEIRKYKYIYNLYFSSIAIFRPLMAMEIYCRVKAKRVLDFTMGWGGRLVGACALGLDAYYGIDVNTHLKKPYQDMVSMLKSTTGHKTAIELFFKDALTIDYSTMDYDTVLTSPPYYNLEKYRKNRNDKNYETQNEWNEKFYKPIFQKTYDGLQKNGHYCLNVPENIYQEACLPILGKYTSKVALKKGERNLNGNYKEYIYIWRKTK